MAFRVLLFNVILLMLVDRNLGNVSLNKTSSTLNIYPASVERFRRLIPYMTFYFTQQSLADNKLVPNLRSQNRVPESPITQAPTNLEHLPNFNSLTTIDATPDPRTDTLAQILNILQQAYEPGGIDGEQRTLTRILNLLHRTNQLPSIAATPLPPPKPTLTRPVVVLAPRPHVPLLYERPSSSPLRVNVVLEPEKIQAPLRRPNPTIVLPVTKKIKHTQYAGYSHIFPSSHDEGSTPGRPGIDYPVLASIPQTAFDCKSQRYKGFFGDPDTSCQVWHYCDLNGGQASFLCPNGTIFSQVALTCDWWFNVRCSSTAQLYVLNERLYKYILPIMPSFPEDYSGPIVDRYLTLKFKDIENNKSKGKFKGSANSPKLSKGPVAPGPSNVQEDSAE